MSKIPNDKRALDYGSAFSIQDSETINQLSIPLELSCLDDKHLVDNFLKLHRKWVSSTVNNTVIGLDNYRFQCYSNGTTESFDKFYLKNHNRRFRCFRGEYLYHRLAWRNNYNWLWLEDDVLDKNDAVVISLPFADTGDIHSKYHNLLKQCDLLNVPVLVDSAYFGICKDIEFNFDYNSITDVVFSLSKTFPIAYARVGVRYSKEDTDDTMFVYQKIDYNNKLGASIGIRFLEKFSADYIAEKYHKKQLEFCKQLGVTPSKTVLFGIGDDKWKEYNRGRSTNRLSFHKQFIQGLK